MRELFKTHTCWCIVSVLFLYNFAIVLFSKLFDCCGILGALLLFALKVFVCMYYLIAVFNKKGNHHMLIKKYTT